MTLVELNDYFKDLLFLWDGKKSKGMNNLIEASILGGLDDFWGAYPWAFKEAYVPITTTESKETVNLPENFE